MNPDFPALTREELEVRLTALLLGELPPAEAEAVRRLAAHDAALGQLLARLEQATHLTQEGLGTADVPCPAPEAGRKLAPEKRAQLLAHFQTPSAAGAAPKAQRLPVLPEQMGLRRLPPPRRKVHWLVSTCAILASLFVLAGLLLPSLAQSKKKGARITTLRANIRAADPMAEVEPRSALRRPAPSAPEREGVARFEATAANAPQTPAPAPEPVRTVIALPTASEPEPAQVAADGAANLHWQYALGGGGAGGGFGGGTTPAAWGEVALVAGTTLPPGTPRPSDFGTAKPSSAGGAATLEFDLYEAEAASKSKSADVRTATPAGEGLGANFSLQLGEADVAGRAVAEATAMSKLKTQSESAPAERGTGGVSAGQGLPSLTVTGTSASQAWDAEVPVLGKSVAAADRFDTLGREVSRGRGVFAKDAGKAEYFFADSAALEEQLARRDENRLSADALFTGELANRSAAPAAGNDKSASATRAPARPGSAPAAAGAKETSAGVVAAAPATPAALPETQARFARRYGLPPTAPPTTAQPATPSLGNAPVVGAMFRSQVTPEDTLRQRVELLTNAAVNGQDQQRWFEGRAGQPGEKRLGEIAAAQAHAAEYFSWHVVADPQPAKGLAAPPLVTGDGLKSQSARYLGLDRTTADTPRTGVAIVLPGQSGPVTDEPRLALSDFAVAQSPTAAGRRAGGVANNLAATEPPAPPKAPANAPVPQPEVATAENAFSTFSLNVADVSFKLAAASLEKGVLPDVATLRSEEFLNAFDYRDPEPLPGAPVGFAWERARNPFAHNRDFLRFSLKTAASGRQAGRALNLVLVLDNSGSMERADRVAIIRHALRVLASQLQPQDRLSVVTFARTPRLWLDAVAGDKAGEALQQIASLTPQGGTDLGEALKIGYGTAQRHYLPGGLNRVVLLTDGAANLGDVAPDSLKRQVETNRKQGIALDCFGIGWEGYNDDLLEMLSRNGDGRYGFVNTPEAAATEFAQQLAGALQVAASDVKVQVEFNPARVTNWRQIGYAKHQLTKEQFRDNTVDAAEIAAQEAGNGLYVIETNPQGQGPLATVRVRYKVPGTADYRELAWPVPYNGSAVPLPQASPAMRLAVSATAFSEWLAGSPFAGEVTPDQLLQVLGGVPATYGADERPKKLEWMIRQAKSLSGK